MKTITSTVGALVHNNKILLLNRKKPPFNGMWCLPGGKIKFGENVDECAVREFEEETGIKTECNSVKGVVSEILHEDDNSMHFLMFVCSLKEKGPVELKESHEGELKWFDLDKLHEHKDNIVGSDYEMIRQLVFGKGENLKIHKSVMRKDGEKYVLESYGAD